MSIGQKIKEFRINKNLTQKQLADELHVTYQAVSRWENDDAEPSFDTLKEMCKIFDCSTDELLGMEKKDETPETETVETPKQEVVETPKQSLTICEQCNSPIYEKEHIHRLEYTSGRNRHSKVLCEECWQKHLADEALKRIEQKSKDKKDNLARRIHSFVWAAVVAILCTIGAIYFFNQGETNIGYAFVATAVCGSLFTATMILFNTFVPEMWAAIASWGFVKMPGIIFEFSIDGFIALIVIKIILFILGMFLAIGAVILATVIAMIVSVFAYPVALVRNFKGAETIF